MKKIRPRNTQDQGAEALAACLVLSAAQAAEDYLNDEELTLSNTKYYYSRPSTSDCA